MKKFYNLGLLVSFIVMLGALGYGVETPRVLPTCFGIVFICFIAIYGFAFLAEDGNKDKKTEMANDSLALAVTIVVLFFFIAFCVAAMRMILS